MATYVYDCTHCGAHLERRVPVDERDAQTCDASAACKAAAAAGEPNALTREEIPLDQGRLSHNWGNWQ